MKVKFLQFDDDPTVFKPLTMCPYNGNNGSPFIVKAGGPHCKNRCEFFKGVDFKKEEVKCLKHIAEKNINFILDGNKKSNKKT